MTPSLSTEGVFGKCHAKKKSAPSCFPGGAVFRQETESSRSETNGSDKAPPAPWSLAQGSRQLGALLDASVRLPEE